MQIIKATGFDRKSGGAQWRDLRFLLRYAHSSLFEKRANLPPYKPVTL
jgi:hypothetical protein